MKKMFTKVLSTVSLAALVLTGFTVEAQQTTLASLSTDKKVEKTDTTVNASAKKTDAAPKPADATFVPIRRLWGYGFGDLYYAPHVDAGNRGAETMYNGVPSNRNAFQFRRIYLGYDYDIDSRFTAEVLLASEPNANTGVNGTTSIQNGDNLVDGKMGFFIKNFNLRYKNIWTGTDLVVGEMSTPGFALNGQAPTDTHNGNNAPTTLSETTWGYRFIEKTITDFHKNNSYDVGASLQGTFDPKTRNFGYVLMVGNNSTSSLLSAANANTGFYKIFYGDIWAKFFNKHLVVDIYGDYAPTAAATATLGSQEHNMQKIFAAYLNPKISIGVEAYTQKISNGVTNTTTKLAEDATVNAISIWAKGAIVKDKMGWFARYDGYNPDTQFNGADSYTVNTNYGSYNPTVKETFYTAGLDFTPAPKIHFAPNLWLIDYKDQRPATTTGYVAPDHTLVVRATFYYTFGK
jgi:hypothetical protein